MPQSYRRLTDFDYSDIDSAAISWMLLTALLIAWSKVDFLTGLLTCISQPASFARRTSSARAEAVRAIIGVRARWLSASHFRIARTALYPSSTGIWMSIRTRSYEAAMNRSSAT